MAVREKHPHSNRSEKQIDEAVEDTSPASDPPSTGGRTRIEPDDPRQNSDHRNERSDADEDASRRLHKPV
ncbi:MULTISPECIES: hypothetical protein [Paraburkholderia]|uniref:Uncharacterized protein n=1 Tax=Paraburkholderia acidicola TaxID=1912599 RepID=A0ABV1LYM6_9BURK